MNSARVMGERITSSNKSWDRWRKLKSPWILELILAFVASTAAAAPTNSIPLEITAPPGMGLSFLRLLGALALVMALFFAGVWFLRNGKVWPASNRTSQLRVLETRSVGPRQSLILVGYQRQRFLVGVSPGGIHMVGVLPEAGPDEPATTSPGFGEALQQVLSQKT